MNDFINNSLTKKDFLKTIIAFFILALFALGFTIIGFIVVTDAYIRYPASANVGLVIILVFCLFTGSLPGSIATLVLSIIGIKYNRKNYLATQNKKIYIWFLVLFILLSTVALILLGFSIYYAIFFT